MKGFIINNGVQYSCDLAGESWKQGDTIKGTIEIQSSEIPSRIVLASGQKKKITTKDPKAYTVLETKEFEVSDETSPFEIILDEDCPISGMYILFGAGDELHSLGSLELPVEPARAITSFLEVLNTFFKFKVKGSLKSNKQGFVEAKIGIPTSQEYSNVVSLKLLLKMNDKNLNVSYNFEVNKVNYVDGDAKLQKVKVVFDEKITPTDYLIYGDSINQDGLMKSISPILEQVKKKQF